MTATGAPGPEDVAAALRQGRPPGQLLGDVRVQTADATFAAAAQRLTAEAAEQGLPGRLVDKDPTLWGPAARAEAAVRLGWLDAPSTSRALLGPVRRLAERFAADGVERYVLAGMGGSSLAPQVIGRTYRAPLRVLDSTDPGQVLAALDGDLRRTAMVVSSKSGGTVETDSHRRAFEQAFRDAGVDPASRMIAVTDPGSPLHQLAAAAGYREVFTADPNVGGRYSALTAFGLVPSGLAGAPVDELLDQAAAARDRLAEPGNAGLALGCALGAGWRDGRDKVVLADGGAGPAGFADWTEQLLAESTGKDGKGLLPVVVEDAEAPGFGPAADTHLVLLGPVPPDGGGTAVDGPLGALFLVWEYATAVAGRLIGINPFDQPNVQESKDNTARVLADAGDGPLPEGDPLLTVGAVRVHAADPTPWQQATDLTEVLAAVLAAVPDRGYLAVMAYLDQDADAAVAALRPALAGRTRHPVTFGWGPRFLHSTGQYHKGGPRAGVYLQITGAVPVDLPVPGRPYSFGRLQLAQALGDLRALADRQRPVARLHLTDRPAGIRQLLAAARELA